MSQTLQLVACGITLWMLFEIYNFNRVYRKVTGDRSYPYVSANRWRLLSLVLRPHPQRELARLQWRFRAAALLWLVSVIALFVAM
ncbi:MAG TPA: hypothetical protein VFU99_11680 [Gaiellaceae bacterium]|nr:hypothetical protein [Gaiellaceae bacterium]